MNEELVRRHNERVAPEDTVYVLGDLVLGQDLNSGLEWVAKMNGHKVIIRGNHDTNNRWHGYASVFDCSMGGDALRLEYRGYKFFLCHYPVLTANFEEHIKACTINLFGHTHQTTDFFEEKPWMYHVGVDSHECCPVSLDYVIQDINKQIEECKAFL